MAYKYTGFDLLSYSLAGRLKGKGGSLISNTSCAHLPVIHTYRKLSKFPTVVEEKGKNNPTAAKTYKET